MSTQRRNAALLFMIAMAAATTIQSAHAQELIVKVTMVKSSQGEVGCALFAGAAGFPTENTSQPTKWQKANPEGVTCRFTGLKPGPHAVAVSHDLNGNRKTDTNFLGIPREDWGVSNNVRPSLRAPTFDEARFEIAASGVTTIEIQLGR